MTEIKVRASKEYSVVIGTGLLGNVGEMVQPHFAGRKLALVSDTNVAPLYADTVTRSLTEAGFSVVRFVFPAGEESKCMATYAALMEFLAENRLSRSDGIVALGGGVVGDLAGFGAATYLRGIGFVQLPTTLLAAVDSSVGGKTGIDLCAGKNLCGAFHQPRLVVCDTDALDTLPKEETVGGMAEVIKYGVIRDSELFGLLEESRTDLLSDKAVAEKIIRTCVGIKRDVVEADEFEGSLRAILNFGHTAAHSIENISGYKIPHGIAVGVGMVIAADYAAKCGHIGEAEAKRIRDTVRLHSLPDTAEAAAEMYSADASLFTPERMAEVALSDKKASGGRIKLVLPTGIGDCVIEETPKDRLAEFMGK